MSQLINITLPKINATAEQHNYQDPLHIRTMILKYWMTDIDTYRRGYKECIKYISDNTGGWAKIKSCFGWQQPDLTSFRNYTAAVAELINLFETRQKCLMSDEFPTNLIGDCPICLEPMLGQPMVLPDCLHPVCTGCFINLCRGFTTYQCPMRCHIIKYVYPLTIHMARRT
jgi:hypothetical protein